jgi:phosphoserine phosphatase
MSLIQLTPARPAPRAEWFPFDVVIFDCDSTLSRIEGIDELARWLGREAEVAALTAQAMNGDLPLEAVYSRRLDMLKPTRDQLRQLGQLYRDTIVPGAAEVITALMTHGREVFVVSGGLFEPVREFGLSLGLPADHIVAVEVEYDQLSGRWWETWTHPQGRNPDERYLIHDNGPLTEGKGKAHVIRRIRARHKGRAMLVGDGTSDLEAGEAVDLFVGFGGVVAREKVRANAEVFINANSLAPVLPLALAAPADTPVYAEGVALIQQGQVTFRNPPAGLLPQLTISNSQPPTSNL